MKNNNFVLLFVISLTIVGQLSGVIYLPSLPKMAVYFHSGESNIKLILLLYLLGFGCSQLFFGAYSDVKGRKKALLVGLICSFVGNFACTVSTSLAILNISRILVGLGSGAAACVGRAILRDIYIDKKSLMQATSIIGSVTALTPAIGPVIGGIIQQFLDWRYNFLFLTLYISLILFICLYHFNETKSRQIPFGTLSNLIKEFVVIIKTPSFTISVLCAAIAFSGLITYKISAPFLFENIIGLTPLKFGIISFFIAGSISAGSLINSKYLFNCSFNQRIKIASSLFILSAFLLYIFYLTTPISTITVFFPALLFSMGVGIIFPTAIANALYPFTKNAGSASALFGFTQMTITMLTNYLFSFVKLNSVLPLSISFMSCGIIIFLLVINNSIL
jgi:Bcr/CflA subfamily drug resistance transporter